MAVKMRTGRLTTKTTDPKTGARIADPSVHGKEIMEGTVSSWPEVRKAYQQGRYKGSDQKLPSDVKNYLEGKTDKLDDKLYDEPYVYKTKDVLGVTHHNFGANLKKGSAREVALQKRFQSSIGKLEEGQDYKFHMSENASSKMAGGYVGTDLEQFRNIKPTPKTSDTNPPDFEFKPEKLKTLEPKIITSSKGKLKKYKGTEEPEKEAFTSPGVETKKKTKTATKRAMTGAGSKGLVKVGGERGVLKSARVTSSVDLAPKMGGYKRQEKLFKAYAGTSVLGESHIGKSAQELGEYKREFKQMKKDYRREGNAEGVVAAGMEANQARLAQKFVRGSQKHFNDPNYKKTTGSENPIAIDYRDSRDNAANRNTMEQKLKSVSSRSKIGKDTGYMNNPMY